MRIEAASDPVPGVFRLFGEFPQYKPGSRWIKFGIVDLDADRVMELTLRFVSRRGFWGRSKTICPLGLQVFDGEEGWPIIGRSRVEVTVSADPPQNHPLLPIRTLGHDLASGFAAAEGGRTFVSQPRGFDAPVHGSIAMQDGRRIISMEGSKSCRTLHLVAADAADAELIARPWPAVVSRGQVSKQDDRMGSALAATDEQPLWNVVRSYLAAGLRGELS